MREASGAAEHGFAVLDGAVIPRLPAELAAREAISFCLYIGEIPADVASAAPHLVMLPRRAGDPLTAWAVAGGREGRPLGLLGRTPVDAYTLRRHLRSLNLVSAPGRASMLFRWYDPAVLIDVLPMLDDGQRRRLFGPITALRAVGRDGKIRDLAAPPGSAETWPRGLLALTAAQMRLLARRGEELWLRALAERLAEANPKLFAKLSETTRLAMTKAAVARGRSWDLVDGQALAKFALLMAKVAPNFDEHPEIARRLAAPGLTPEERLAALDRDLPPGVWREAAARPEPTAWFLAQDDIDAIRSRMAGRPGEGA